MDNIDIESKWRSEIKGSPIVQLNNGKWQTWVQVKGKRTDRGRQRFTNKNRDELVVSLEKVMHRVRTGAIVLEDTEVNMTAHLCTHHLLKDLQKDWLAETVLGKKRAISERINRLHNLLKILESYEDDKGNKLLLNTPMQKWGIHECDLFIKGIGLVSRKQTPNSNNKYFTQLRLLFSYAKVVHNVPIQVNIIDDYMKQQYVRQKGFFLNAPSLRVRKNNLKKLIRKWDIDMMKEFFETQIPYEQNPLWHMALYVIANTGLRCGELFALQSDDFYYSHNGGSYLVVSGFVDNHGNRTEIGKTESAEQREIPIGKGLAEKLKTYIPSIQSSPLVSNPDGILFPQLAGHKNNTGSTTRTGEATYYKACVTKTILADIMKGKFELPKGLKFHFFRSWVATKWYSNEIYNDYEMTSILGHADIRTTQESYIHVAKRHKVNKNDFLDNYLF